MYSLTISSPLSSFVKPSLKGVVMSKSGDQLRRMRSRSGIVSSLNSFSLSSPPCLASASMSSCIETETPGT